MTIGINCGHTVSGTIGCGVKGRIDESVETRAVGYALMHLLKKQGHKVIDCTNDYASSVNENLRQICTIANSWNLDYFISIHLNAGGGKGAEVYTMGGENKAYASEMLEALEELGFRNRGIKDGSHLYVINKTNAPAALVEICFVDSDDVDLYKSIGAENIAKAICSAIIGASEYKEELTMSQYQELNKRIDKLENPMIYNYIDDNMPDWAKPTIQKLVDKGILKGQSNGRRKWSTTCTCSQQGTSCGSKSCRS